MELLKSLEIVEAMNEEVKKLLEQPLGGKDLDNAIHLQLGLLWVANKLLLEKIEKLEEQEKCSTPTS